MGTKLFETWQLEEAYPPPFQEEIEKKNGVKYSTAPSFCSVHNTVTRGKKSTLYPVVVRALIGLIRAQLKEDNAAAGFQIGGDNELAYYCLEYEKSDGRYAVVYNPNKGQFKSCVFELPEITRVQPDVCKGGNNGEEFLMLLAYASLERHGNLFDSEFQTCYEILKEQYVCDWNDRTKALMAAYVCSDNLYRRIENGDTLGGAGIPFDKERFDMGSVDFLSYATIQSGVYSPNMTYFGEFTVFKKLEKQMEYDISEMKEKYGRNYSFPEHLECLVPRLPDSYKVNSEAAKILDMIQKTPVRTFLITGSAGVNWMYL